ncbi:DUF192 domain-containing protein [Adlercreutzia equolifaciens]|uniref:DUF192 domain-containing protein n=1 Tax=Adlercreutzia equolifaciens TaxID=446660 RepID=UPI0023B0CA91|nr:DUF192 domain-containing protein [Adlercreutzia equolifaciens]MDE8702055.1 DUF192 domain-containing protein [Adlercreutzia equolifaciens]
MDEHRRYWRGSQRRRSGVWRVKDGAGAPFGGIWCVARSPWRRLRGLAGGLPDRRVMVFPRCRDVHTLTMRRNLDILFVDEAGRVLEVHRKVRPKSRLRCPRAFGAVERFAQPGPWFQRGDVISVPGCREYPRVLRAGEVGPCRLITAESLGLGRRPR